MHKTTTSVATAAGELRAIVWRPDGDELLPGVVLVDGAMEGTADDTWAEFAAVLVDCGAVALSHDKPGCGSSPGDWRSQSLHDRARESLAAVEVLRQQPGVDPDRIGLLGVSQGGWVSYLAASMAPDAVSATSLFEDPAAGLHEDASARLPEHPALLGCLILRRASPPSTGQSPGSRWWPTRRHPWPITESDRLLGTLRC
jgi:uncharacterized protein